MDDALTFTVTVERRDVRARPLVTLTARLNDDSFAATLVKRVRRALRSR